MISACQAQRIAGADAYAETMHGEDRPLPRRDHPRNRCLHVPEQADGKKVDSRSDVFSFGSVLYEMTTGQRAFAGGSKLSSLLAVLYKDPQPASQTAAEVPPELDRIIGRCLKKDPERRWHTMADVKVALEELRGDLDFSNFALAGPTPVREGSAGRLWTGLGCWPESCSELRCTSRLSGDIVLRPNRLRSASNLSTWGCNLCEVRSGRPVVYSAEWDGAPSTLFSAQPGNREARPLALASARVLRSHPR